MKRIPVAFSFYSVLVLLDRVALWWEIAVKVEEERREREREEKIEGYLLCS